MTNGFYNEQRFFRVVPGFVVQWGMSGDPEITKEWANAQFLDDPSRATREGAFPLLPNRPNSRTTQVFINLGDNTNLDGMRFAPFGEVTEGMDVVDKINADAVSRPLRGISPSRVTPICRKRFPTWTYIKSVRVD